MFGEYGFRRFITENPWDNQIIDAYLGTPHMKVSEIARNFGKSEAEIYRILHANDVAPNRLKSNHAKVKHLAELGWNHQQIAEFTGYTTRNVRYILSKQLSEGN